MQTAKSILSHLLLVIYLLVVLHQSAAHSHATGPEQYTAHHYEDDLQSAHHHHHFHGGLFHFLGHLFESISHTDDFAEEHLVSVQKFSGKKVADNKILPADIPAFSKNDIVLPVDAASLPGPPVYHNAAHKGFPKLAHPLRGPPLFV